MVDGRGATATDPEAPTDDACLGLSPERIRRLCDRRFGIGADGLIVAAPPREGGELRMRIFNADGSEPEMCGNGIRCLARFLADSDGDLPGRRWQVETLAGRIVPELQPDGSVRVDMGQPFLAPETVPTTLTVGEAGIPQGALEAAGERFQVGAAGMGNPHVVIPVPDVDSVDLERFGAALEVHPAFPARTNVHFVQMLTPTHLVMRVWERGAGPTLACGTGACATLVVCHALGLAERSARVDLPGGSLQISWDSADDHVWMTGPAEAVFDAVIAPSLWDPEGMDDLGEASSSAEAAPRAEATSPPPEPAVLETAGVDCATVCVQGCIRPDDCPSAAARARVEALLSSSSLDDLVNLAANSLENRIRARAERPSSPGG